MQTPGIKYKHKPKNQNQFADLSNRLYIMRNLTFEYVIQRQIDKKYYRGTAYGDARDWTTETRESCGGAYHYTRGGAAKKIATFPLAFKDCTVEHIV